MVRTERRGGLRRYDSWSSPFGKESASAGDAYGPQVAGNGLLSDWSTTLPEETDEMGSGMVGCVKKLIFSNEGSHI